MPRDDGVLVLRVLSGETIDELGLDRQEERDLSGHLPALGELLLAPKREQPGRARLPDQGRQLALVEHRRQGCDHDAPVQAAEHRHSRLDGMATDCLPFESKRSACLPLRCGAFRIAPAIGVARVVFSSTERGPVAEERQTRNASTRRAAPGRATRSSRSKRSEIIASSVERFGNGGYEDTKWADIAADVGLGSTALYHYFESKLHCLYEIHAEALDAEYERFNRVTSTRGEFGPMLVDLLAALVDLTDHEILRNRVLVAEQGLLAVPRSSTREEEARRRARARMRDIEFAWAAFLTRGMEQGAIPETDPRLLTRALLGLYNSVWHWYRPAGGRSVEEVRDFFVERCLVVAGYDAAVPLPATPTRKPRIARKAA